MKKILKLLSFSIMLCSSSLFLGSCSSPLSNKTSINKLDKMFVSLKNADSIGIQKREENSTFKNYLVTFDENNNIKDVIFVYENEGSACDDDGECTKEVTQEQINGQIKKVFTAKDYIYVQYTIDKLDEENIDDDYYYTDYITDKSNSSYVIARKSGKVYSLEQFPNITYVTNDIIQNDGIYYQINVDTNYNLKVTKLISNPNITISSVLSDIYGNVYVENSASNEIVGNIYYYKKSTDTRICIGLDNYAYLVQQNSTSEYSIKVFNAKLSLSNPTASSSFTFKAFGDTFIFHKNVLYRTVTIGVWPYTSNGNGIYKWDVYSSYSYPSDILQKIIIDTRIYYISNSKGLFVVNIDTFSNIYSQLIKDDVTSIEQNGTSLIATIEKISGTLVYEITYKDGKGYITQINDIQYFNSFIIIQPLN